ncbi:maleylpyruvate isomerase N-terminal domain-containing protein [Parafrigoribacterium mesophilum]|uniref:DinB family protein n=1 Tax=Parafrigoribacterium mesophilum TaxID=433646 RepID=UPI0031FCB631
MPIVPDTKDWTWVLRRPCPQCGFDAAAFEPREVAGKIRANAKQWPAVLQRADAAVRLHPDVWSAVEYGAHVRDVLRLFKYRVALMLQSDDPTFPSWDGDALAVAERYSEQEPVRVAAELEQAAAEYAAELDSVPEHAWSRTGRRGDGALFTVASLALYSAHDPMHHLWDVH